MNFAERVKCLRISRGLNQGQVAERAGVVKSYVSMVESGDIANPTLDSLEKIAKGLGVSMCQLLQDRPEEIKHVPERMVAYITTNEFLPYMEAAIEAFDKRVPVSALHMVIRGWSNDK